MIHIRIEEITERWTHVLTGDALDAPAVERRTLLHQDVDHVNVVELFNVINGIDREQALHCANKRCGHLRSDHLDGQGQCTNHAGHSINTCQCARFEHPAVVFAEHEARVMTRRTVELERENVRLIADVAKWVEECEPQEIRADKLERKVKRVERKHRQLRRDFGLDE